MAEDQFCEAVRAPPGSRFRRRRRVQDRVRSSARMRTSDRHEWTATVRELESGFEWRVVGPLPHVAVRLARVAVPRLAAQFSPQVRLLGIPGVIPNAAARAHARQLCSAVCGIRWGKGALGNRS